MTNETDTEGAEWVVMWEILATGYRGCGSPMPYHQAKRTADYSNEKWIGEIRHWPEPLPDVSGLLGDREA